MILFIIILNIFLFSGQVDSIKNELKKESNLANQLKIINNNYHTLLSDSLVENELLLLEIENKLKINSKINNDLKFDFYYLLANLYKEKGEYDLAIEYNFKAFQFAERSTIVKNLAKYYLLFGELYYLMGDYNQAIEYDLLGLKFSEEQADSELKTYFQLMLAKVSIASGNYADSENYLLEILNSEIAKNKTTLVFEANLFLSKTYLALKNINKAEKYLLKNQDLLLKINNKELIANNYIELINLYSYKNDYDNALETAIDAIPIAKQLKNKVIENNIELKVAKIYLQLKLYSNAHNYLKNMEEFVNSLANDNFKLDYYYTLLKLYESMNDFKSAFLYQKKYVEIKDKIMHASSEHAISDALVKYEADKKERELELTINKAELEKQKGIIVFTISSFIGFVILIIAIYLFRRSRKQRKQNELLKYKNEEIENQREELELLNKELIKRNSDIEEINHFLSKQEYELRDLNATKDKFLSIIAHDLKNPIAGIMMTSELLIQYYDKFDKEKLINKIGEINSASIRLKELLENLLEWARASTGQIPYNPGSIQLEESILKINELFQSNLRNKNIKLQINDIVRCYIFADRKMFDTIIRNLVSNAIKFTPENGKIIINSETIGNKIKINIEDNGVGIPEDKLSQIFSIASNYSTLGTQKEKGTGLGLILCKEFVDINKGEIEVKSEQGKGTTFSLSFNKYIE